MLSPVLSQFLFLSPKLQNLLQWKKMSFLFNIVSTIITGSITHILFWNFWWIIQLAKGNAKECSNYCTIALISHASKVMLKILQARLQQYVNCELPDVQAEFRKGRGTRDQILNIHWIIKKARRLQKKTSTSALLTTPKPLTVWITTNCGKFLKRWAYQTTWPPSWEICVPVKKQQLELDMEQQTGSK